MQTLVSILFEPSHFRFTHNFGRRDCPRYVGYSESQFLGHLAHLLRSFSRFNHKLQKHRAILINKETTTKEKLQIQDREDSEAVKGKWTSPADALVPQQESPSR